MLASHKKTIIVLDDEGAIPDLVAAELGTAANVKHFKTMIEFFDFVDGHHFVEEDCIALIDIKLGQDVEAGFHAAKALVDRGIQLPTIFVSSSALMANITRSAELGSHAYLLKDRVQADSRLLHAAIAQAQGAYDRTIKQQYAELNQWGIRAVVLAGSLGHDIRSLVAPMQNKTLALKFRAEQVAWLESTTILNSCEQIIKDLNRVQAILNSAFNFMRKQPNVLFHSEIELVSFVRALVDQSKGEYPSVRFISCCEAQVITADEVRVTQMVNNLIDNAQKYASDGEFIDVFLTLTDKFVEIRVRDYGKTRFTPWEVRQLWKPLKRGENAQMYEGSGIGLAIVKEFAEMHGGAWLHDYPTDNERGNIFGFTLPLHYLQESQASQAP